MEEKMNEVINQIKELIDKRKFNECEAIICTAMFENPHNAVPHNLMGLMLEMEGCHTEAMKHFRAAWALDPTYEPASWNLECFSSFYRTKAPAFCISDCIKQNVKVKGREEQCI